MGGTISEVFDLFRMTDRIAGVAFMSGVVSSSRITQAHAVGESGGIPFWYVRVDSKGRAFLDPPPIGNASLTDGKDIRVRRDWDGWVLLLKKKLVVNKAWEPNNEPLSDKCIPFVRVEVEE